MRKVNEIWNTNFLGRYVTAARKKELRVAVHSGIFHADDVYCVALLDLAFDLAMNRTPNFNVGVNFEMSNFTTTRTRDERLLDASDILLDVGYEYDCIRVFDHHQKNVPKNVLDDIPHSAFGLLAEVVLLDSRVLDEFRKTTVISIEARDNGLPAPEGYGISGEWVACFNPNWDESADAHARFIEAAYVAKRLLYLQLNRIVSSINAEALVDEAVKSGEDTNILVLDKFVPWKSHVFRHYPDILAAVFLGHSGWTVSGALLKGEDDMTQKFYFPEGFEAEGMTFLHKARFMAVFDSKEHAIAAAKKAIEANQ